MIVQAGNVSKSFGTAIIFEDVNFTLNEGDRVALIGENGSGKSTLFRLLAGRTKPDTGVISVAHGATIGLMEQEPHCSEESSLLSVALDSKPELHRLQESLRQTEEQMASPEAAADPKRLDALLEKYSKLQEQMEMAGGYSYEAKVRSILLGLGFAEAALDQPSSSLSGGEKKLLALAQLLIEQPDLVLLDEPDNHLDLKAKHWLVQYILSHKGAVAIISHDRYFLDSFINHIFELEDGKIFEYHCNYSGFREAKQQRLEREARLYELQKRQLEELRESAEKLTRWASLNDKFAGRAKNRRRMLGIEIERLENTPKPVLNRRTIDLDFSDTERSGRDALIIDNLGMAYGNRVLFEPFSLKIRYGESVGVVGPNGSGKSTLFKILLGQQSPEQGSVRFGHNVRVGYYSQEQESLDFSQTPLEFIRNLLPIHEDRAVAFLRGKLNLTYAECYTAIGKLSGGQKSRLQLAGLSLAGVNFLLLDEPTNNLDIPSMIVLEEALLDFEGTILTISHDRYFLDQIVEKILAFDGRQVREYPGTFSEFYERTQGAIDIGTVNPLNSRLLR